MARMSPRAKGGEDLVEDAVGLLAGDPFRLAAQQIFLGDHLEDGADVLRHAAVDEHERILELLPGVGGHVVVRRERVCVGIRRPRVMPCSGSPSPATVPCDQLDAGPDAAGVLPAAAGAADPLAEHGAGERRCGARFPPAAR